MRDETDPPRPLLAADDLVVGHEGVASCAPVTMRLQAGAALALIGPFVWQWWGRRKQVGHA